MYFRLFVATATSALLAFGCPDAGPQVPTGTHKPDADAGPDQIARVGARVQLAGQVGDVDGDLVPYAWYMSSAPADGVQLNDSASLTPWFIASAPGIYVFSLRATDTRPEPFHRDYVEDSVSITALPPSDCSTATLASGETKRATITEGETDTYTFCVQAGQAVTVQMIALEGSDWMFTPVITLLDPNGNTVFKVKGEQHFGVDGRFEAAEVTELPLEQAGVYMLLCSAHLAENGIYDLTLVVK